VERFRVIGIAYRQWAIEYPQRYQLIFGTPIPGYEAPFMDILPSAARSLSALVSVIADLRIANKLQADGFPQLTPATKSNLRSGKIIPAIITSFRFQFR
jgi:hypothetical protein